jgi:hypothetical protein
MKRFSTHIGVTLLLTLGLGGIAALALLWLLGGSPSLLIHAQGPDTHSVYYVAPGASCGAGADPCYATVQEAADAADDPGDVIKVAAGIYTDVNTRAGVPQVVYISATVAIRGGYTTTNWTTPYPITQTTTLDALGLGRVLYIVGDISPTVEGLRISGGNATGLGGRSSGDAGGGIYAVGAAVTLSDNLICDNVATTIGFGYGGGVYLASGSAILSANTIRDNVASRDSDGYGGGVGVYQSDVTMSGNTILSNTASVLASYFGAGGGISAEGGTATLYDNTILSNTAVIAGSYDGWDHATGFGGGMVMLHTDGTLISNTIRGNVANGFGPAWGGGVHLQERCVVTLTDNVIRDNTASADGTRYSDGYGGGVSVLGSSSASLALTLIDNTITDNVAAISGGLGAGGGIGLFGSYYGTTLISVTSVHNTFLRNTAAVSSTLGAGGGIAMVQCNASLISDTILGNTAVISDGSAYRGAGGGVYLGVSLVRLDGDIIQGNDAGHLGDGMGGGVFVEESDVQLINTVLIDNWSTTGAGMAVAYASTVESLHSTIARNRGGDGSGICLRRHRFYIPTDIGPPSTVALTNTILVSHTVGITVTGSDTVTVNGILWYSTPMTISAVSSATIAIDNQSTGNPRFAVDGYHLTTGSAAINLGITAGVLTDVDGDARSDWCFPDLGADELITGIDCNHVYMPLVRRQSP